MSVPRKNAECLYQKALILSTLILKREKRPYSGNKTYALFPYVRQSTYFAISIGLTLSSNLTRAGNAKILNADTGNDLLTETNMTSFQFTWVWPGLFSR
ncbi:uncharacterized protein N7529_008050 [Penicillium soppii]|uniref:uncharacterized protein n=1 Tax=Penicillium soppii TaxID=69789 RepID=UPI002548B908|nr:uncharacterized protein N7529_008050 [Penicillium soppii]KAJ5860740.1 hypothetical protein N7529_008050 [Penicillium soppii]